MSSIALPGALLLSEMRQCLGKSYYTRADVKPPRDAPFQPKVARLANALHHLSGPQGCSAAPG